MNLWIRSQDKGLYEIVGFKPPICCDDTKPNGKYAIIGICHEYRTVELGIYETGKRALEVLDEIQNILKPKFMIRMDSNLNNITNFLNINGSYIKNDNNADIKNINNTFVYEMPQE